MEKNQTRGLPLKGSLQPIQVAAGLVLALMVGLSVIGLVLADRLYPTEEFIQSFMTNDLVNLALGVPVLAVALWLAGRGKLTGLFLLPGSMLYVVYNSLAYVFGRPFDLYSGGHLVLILICGYAAYLTLSRMEHAAIQAELGEKIPAKFSGWVLGGFGVLFFFRAVGVFAGALFRAEQIAVSEVGVLVADMVLSVLLFACGLMLLRRKAVGVAAGLGLLYAASMLFVGLTVLLAVQSVLVHSTLPVVDMLVVLTMGLVCFVPFGRYLKVCA